MTTEFENNSQFVTGKESCTYAANESATAVTVANAVFGELAYREMQLLIAAGIEDRAISVELDKADLAAALITTAPARNGIIVRSVDSTRWRIKSVQSDHVIGVHRCVLLEIQS